MLRARGDLRGFASASGAELKGVRGLVRMAALVVGDPDDALSGFVR
jgi:hypothetical protein